MSTFFARYRGIRALLVLLALLRGFLVLSAEGGCAGQLVPAAPDGAAAAVPAVPGTPPGRGFNLAGGQR